MSPLNPFIITSDYVSDKYFCDRRFETDALIANILNGRNTVLISPRRMGKSGLVSHVFAQKVIASRFRTFSIDLYAANSLSEMILFLGRTITDSLKSAGKKRLERFFQMVQSLRPGFKLDHVTGQFRFDLALGDIERPRDSLEEIFSYLESSETPCLVAVDEFQQIADFPEENVLELLRTYVQKCKNTYFIFSGSKRRMMDKIFNNPSEPFYMSCVPLYLDAIDKDLYYPFAANLFAEAGKSLGRDCFDRIYDKLEGHTWYVQHILNELYGRMSSGDEATVASVDGIFDYVVSIGSRGFEERFSNIAQSQKALLIAIAREGKVSAPTSMDFVRRNALKSPSTVQSALKILYENETVTRENSTYSITNRFFSFWIRRVYAGGGI